MPHRTCRPAPAGGRPGVRGGPPPPRGALENHPPQLHHVGAVGDPQPGAGVLLDEQDGGLLAHGGDHPEHLGHHQRRQPQRRLVEQHQPRAGHPGPRDGQHLLLTAREQRRRLLAPLGEDREAGGQLVQVALDVAVAPRVGAHFQVLEHGHAAEDAAALGHVGDAAGGDGVRGQAGQVGAVVPHRSRARAEQAGDGAEQRRLAGAVGAEHGDHLARPHLERDALQRRDRAVVNRQALHAEQGCRRLGQGTPLPPRDCPGSRRECPRRCARRS